MINFVKFLYYTFALPPGIFIIALLVVSLFALKKKLRIWRLLLGITIGVYILSIPLVGNVMIHTLEKKYTPPAEIKGDVIIMLGGGATGDTPGVNGTGHLSGYAANRLLTCAQLYHKLDVPILISGGNIKGVEASDAVVGKNILIGLGVPQEKIISENKSLNTTQNASFTKDIIEKNGFKSPILVTSAFHMHRSVKQFEKHGINVIPYPTDYQTNIKYRFGLIDLVPNADALSQINLTLKEYLGILVLKWY
ncbi:YdcF family protein [Pseudobacteroides cellulosolvens]|uniref:DUF218 domain-containing protein n=1 Tax=Pseudobacteroides cellulosolvens ATCC 35603 = DSM 2933 TaxID=398512 RepID=A0A0L6JS40_9FIRM|nr:YdcF family protein [Pseudobacteroides cellulosolvens]KNY28530.1 protein of unknown function DUF218 [Pseudobacteroides cellulosolvens ATCC 35603 = DSM 2933]